MGKVKRKGPKHKCLVEESLTKNVQYSCTSTHPHPHIYIYISMKFGPTTLVDDYFVVVLS